MKLINTCQHICIEILLSSSSALFTTYKQTTTQQTFHISEQCICMYIFMYISKHL